MSEVADKVEVDLNKLVSVYLKLRDAIQEKEEQHKQEVQELQVQFDVVAGELLGHCNTQNIDSIRTPVGTISRRISTRYWTSDWDNFYSFIMEHNIPQVLERRVHQNKLKEFLENNPDLLPPGMNVDSEYSVTVQRRRK